MHVDRARVAKDGAAPEHLEQHSAAVDTAGMGRKRPQELELDVGQRDRAGAYLHQTAAEVDPQPVRHDDVADPCRARDRGATKQRSHAAPELTDRERLRDVVVRAELEPEDLVQLVVAGGEHDDRHRALAAQAPAHLESVELRQHHVEDDEVERLGREPLERLLSVARGHDAKPLAFERIREELLDGVLVVDEEDR